MASSTPKLLVVFGATGQQGGSVANFVVADPELSKQYKVRAVTRDVTKPAAKALQEKGMEVVAGDLDDAASIQRALEGAHAVFLTTNTLYEPDGLAHEVAQGKAVADAAVAAGVQQVIFCTQRSPKELSGGALSVDSFESKVAIEAYLRGLPLRTGLFAPGGFMPNLLGMSRPQPAGDGTFRMANVQRPDAPTPWIDIAADTGKFVGAMLADPEKYDGKFFAASSCFSSFAETARILSERTGKTVNYVQLPEEQFKKFMPPNAAETVTNMFKWIDQYRYYGPNEDEDVKWAMAQARGKLTTSLEDFLERNPLKLEG